MKSLILIVEDDLLAATLLELQLRDLGYTEIMTAPSAAKALQLIEEEEPDLIISGLMMPETSGQELLVSLREKGHTMPFVIYTGYGSIESAVEAMKCGALDYMKKDCPPEDLAIIVKRALEFSRHSKFKEHVVKSHNFRSIITNSPAMITALKAAEKVAASPRTTVTLFGESGGRERGAGKGHPFFRRWPARQFRGRQLRRNS